LNRAAIVTISDSAHSGTREDLSGPAVRARLEQLGWLVDEIRVVPDEPSQIAALLIELADQAQVGAIFTTGGTGLGPRDRTPEATRSVIEYEVPGISECMRADGRQKTPTAILSRGICGVRGTTLIVNLPGSPKGATESLSAIVEVVPHAIQLLRGHTDHAESPKRGARQ
jgi:molybdenum cofactor synthesis domain-containing protein